MPDAKTSRADERYKWVALANTTAAIFMAALDGSIVIIALPAIFRGIHLDPLSPGNISYGERHRGKIDWWGNATFALGLGALLVGITYGIQPYGGHSMGWTNPVVLGEMIGGTVLLAVFVIIETKIAEPMFRLTLFKIRAFTAGNVAGLLVSIARGGIQFMLIIWLQGIWLPLHGYDYSATPLWAGIFLLPMTAGFLVAGPVSGILSDKFGSRGIATAGMAVFAASFIALMLLPVNFPYWAFAVLVAMNGVGSGMFAAPNSSSIMGSVPARDRGAASGMRATFQNSGTAVSIGVVFTLMIVGLSRTLPSALSRSLMKDGVPAAVAHHVATLPPVASLFASVLGVNPVRHLLAHFPPVGIHQPAGVLARLPVASQHALTGREFFPSLLSGPFHGGLIVVFGVSAALSVLAGLASLLRGSGTTAPPSPADSGKDARARVSG